MIVSMQPSSAIWLTSLTIILISCRYYAVGHPAHEEATVLPRRSTRSKEVNEQLRSRSFVEVKTVLEGMMQAVTSDINWHHVMETVNADCQEMAKNINEILKNSFYADADVLMEARISISETINAVRDGQQQRLHPLEIFCNKMETKFKIDQRLSSNYRRMSDRILADKLEQKKFAELPISLQQLYTQMRRSSIQDLDFLIVLMALTTSDGDDLFHTTTEISAECMAKANASVKPLFNLLTSVDDFKVFSKAVTETLITIIKGNQRKHPMEIYCQALDAQLKTSLKLRELYTRIDNDTNRFAPETRKHRMNFVYDRRNPGNFSNVLQMLNLTSFVRLRVISDFLLKPQGDNIDNSEYETLPKLILYVARKEADPVKIYQIQENVIAEIHDEIMERLMNATLRRLLDKREVDWLASPIVEKFTKYFNADNDLRSSLQGAIHDPNKTAEFSFFNDVRKPSTKI